MTLQLPSFLDASSDKHLKHLRSLFWWKKPPKLSKKLRKKLYMLIDIKKPPKLNRKTRRKTKDLINKKPSKLDKEMKKKTNHLRFIYCFVKGEKPPKPS